MKNKVLLTLISAISSAAFAASFDCKKASTYVEQMICKDKILGKLDDALSQNFRGMQSSDIGFSTKKLKAEQMKWLSDRNRCTSYDCILKAYRKRVDETCDYPVTSGVHEICTLSEDVR